MDGLQKLSKKQATLRGLVTKLVNKINKALEDLQTEPTRSDLAKYVLQLEDKEGKLKEVNSLIEDLITNEEEYEDEILEAEDWQDKIVSAKAMCHERINELNARSTVPGRSCSRERISIPFIKLPRINIEMFTGEDESKWPEFWMQYHSTIHDNRSISEGDKFSYLKSYLGGTALMSIAGLQFTDENYQTAIDLLEKRFGSRHSQIQSHTQKIRDLEAVRRSSDAKELRRFYDSLNVSVKSLESLELDPEAYGSFIIPVVTELLPTDMVFRYSQATRKDDVLKISGLMNFLQDEVESRERMLKLKKTPLPPERDFKERNRNSSRDYQIKKNPLPSTSAFNTTVQPVKGSNYIKCLFCQASHSTEACTALTVSQRREILKTDSRCYVCLRKGHKARFCRTKGVTCSNCGQRHSQVLCEKLYPDTDKTKPPEIKDSTDNTFTNLMSTICNKRPSNVIYLQTASARVIRKNKEVAVRVLLDSGSHRTFLLESVSSQLGLPCMGKENLNIQAFGAEVHRVQRRRVQFELGNFHNTETTTMDALETPKISGTVLSLPSPEVIEFANNKCLKLADIPLGVNEPSKEISLLVGADFYWTIVRGKMERINSSLMVIDTRLGWCLLGSSDPKTTREESNAVYNISIHSNFVQEPDEEERISENLKAFWDLDTLGIVESFNDQSDTYESLREQFKSKITFNGQRYSVGLPWKEDVVLKNNNYNVAFRRFQYQLKKFRKDPILFAKYNEVIESHLSNSIAEPAPYSETPGRTFYLPHREIVKLERSTTKIRVVFDASSHSIGSLSLNNCLHPGPSLNVDLLGLLLKFRKYNDVFTADVEKAFLQVGLNEEDRDVTRFLWVKNCQLDPGEEEIVVLRMTRVLLGINASPYLLAQTIGHHMEKCKIEYPKAYDLLTNSLYVDDVLGGAKDEQEALDVAKEAIIALQKAGLPLRKFQSNSEWLTKELRGTPDENMKSLKTEDVSLMVLGIAWQPNRDVFRFDVSTLLEFLCQRKDTKRFILQASSRVFDPVGFLSPFTIRIKCLFQELWQRTKHWEDAIPEDLKIRWNSWCLELSRLSELKIPRTYGLEEIVEKVELHCFTDASERAYGAAIYVRIVKPNELVTVTLVSSKCRVAPLQKQTIPRLELLGAVVGTKLMSTVKKYFEDERPSLHFWTDSTIALSWIKGVTKIWKPFISNRTSKIQEAYEPKLWSHVPGKINPADLLTRGLSVGDLIESQLWWNGPSFLKESRSSWPKQADKVLSPEEKNLSDIERRTSTDTTEVFHINTENSAPLLTISNYSKFKRPIRIIAWVLRAVQNFKNYKQRTVDPLTPEELDVGENYWIKKTQGEMFCKEISAVKNKVALPKDSLILDLKPFLDEEGIMRLGGRLQFSDLSPDEKHPIILPASHPFTHLVITRAHQEVMHMKVSATMANLRNRFWIPKARQTIKKLLYQCRTCKREKSKPIEPQTAPLPPERINPGVPFESTGVDFAGPVLLKTYDVTKKSYVQTKGYIALFSCTTTRAVHLELVSSQSTDNFLMALRRFIARRGVCSLFLSDNAKTFKKADRELSKLWKFVVTDELKNYFGEKGIKWRFIVDRAPWWGGMWERMVRTMKDCLKKILGRSLLTYEEMETVVTEAESVINSRPITYDSNSYDDLSPLTPSHFLIGKRLDALPTKRFTIQELQSTRESLTKRWKYRQTLTNRFWTRWRKEYLLELRTAQKVKGSKNNQTQLQVGDVVILREDKLPRHLWKLGRVSELHPGRDEVVRSCTLRNINGNYIKRPLPLLYPLEVN